MGSSSSTPAESLHGAIRRGDSKQVQSLISDSSIDINAPLFSKQVKTTTTPALMVAVWYKRKTIVDILLKAGARVDVVNAFGETPLHTATRGGDCELLALLLAHKPNLELKCDHGTTALAVAIDKYRIDAALMLLEAGASVANLNAYGLVVAAALSTDLIQALLDRGVAIDELRDVHGVTPLHNTRNLDAMRMLVNVCGCDLDARDSLGATSCHWVAINDNRPPMRFLIEAGADFDIADDRGCTPLYKSYHLECTMLLLAAGADVHARNFAGGTPCHEVAAAKFECARNVVPALLAAGADLDAPDHSGTTVRQILATRGWSVCPTDVSVARRRIATLRLDFVRHRALQVCIGLQSRGLDALQTCEILFHACGRFASLIAFHQWWKIATTVKHFKN